MSIEDLGNLGEAVGAVATLVTLLYLAIQIRRNTQVMQAEARRSHYAIGRENNALIAANRDVSDLMLRGLLDPNSLDQTDENRFTFLMASFMSNAELGYFEHEIGVIPESESLRAIRATARLLRSPGGQRFWKRHRRNYQEPFRSFIEEVDVDVS